MVFAGRHIVICRDQPASDQADARSDVAAQPVRQHHANKVVLRRVAPPWLQQERRRPRLPLLHILPLDAYEQDIDVRNQPKGHLLLWRHPAVQIQKQAARRQVEGCALLQGPAITLPGFGRLSARS